MRLGLPLSHYHVQGSTPCGFRLLLPRQGENTLRWFLLLSLSLHPVNQPVNIFLIPNKFVMLVVPAACGATGRSTICIALGHLPNLVLDTGLLVVTSGVRARQFPVIIAGISSQ